MVLSVCTIINTLCWQPPESHLKALIDRHLRLIDASFCGPLHIGMLVSDRACDICQSHQEGHPQYNVKEPVVGQRLHVQKSEMLATLLTGHVKPAYLYQHMYAHKVAVLIWMHRMGCIHTTGTYSNPPDLVNHQSQDTHREVSSSFPVEAVMIRV